MMKASIFAAAAVASASAAPLAPNELLLASFDRCAPLRLAEPGWLIVWLSCICWSSHCAGRLTVRGRLTVHVCAPQLVADVLQVVRTE